MTRAEWKIERSDRQLFVRRGSTVSVRREGDVVARQYDCDRVSSGARLIETRRNSQRLSVMPQAIQAARAVRSPHAFRLRNGMREAVVPARLPILPGPNGCDLQSVVLEIA